MNVPDTLLKILINDQPDPVRCSYFVADLVKRLDKDAYAEPRRVVACGECAPTQVKSEDWLQLAEQGSGLGWWHWDEIEQTLYWDSKTRRMFGVPAQGEITLQTFEDALHPDDRDRVMQNWRHCFEKSLPYSVELRVLRPDGNFHWLQGLGKGHYDKKGKPIYMAGVAFGHRAQTGRSRPLGAERMPS